MTATAKVHRRSASPFEIPRGPRPFESPVRPATSDPVDMTIDPGAVLADPALASRSRRGAYPVAPPSWRAFRAYASDRTEFDELRQVGLASMMRTHRAFALAVAAVAAFVLFTAVALTAYFLLTPATAEADSPYATADVAPAESTPANRWKAGEIPSLYQSDDAWGTLPYGQATLAETGAAPTALAMAYVAVTGRGDKTPSDFAQWATDHDLTASGVDTVSAFFHRAAAECGLELEAVDGDERSLRRAIVANVPVLVITEPGTFSPAASAIVLDDIDRDSRVVIHDPASAARTGKSWSFEDITAACASAFTVTAV